MADEGWEMTASPKRRPTDPKPASPDGTELTVTPRKSATGTPAAPGPAPDGTMELPGTPRPKPNPPAAVPDEEAEFRRQVPKAVEEDAEVWDASKGWTTPSGRTDGLAPGVAESPPESQEAAPQAPTVQADDDTEVYVAPKRVLPPEPRTAPASRSPSSMAAARQGKDGVDFQEYVKPVVPPAPSLSPTRGPTPASPFASVLPGSPDAAAEPFRAYGASAAPAPPPSAAPPPMAPPGQVHAAGLPAGTLNVLLVGSGAREHAMALALRRSQRCHLYVVMKHRNPGLAKSATGFKLLDDRDAAGIVAWAKAQRIHLAVAGPESALEAGVTDALRAAGIAVASPSQAAARIETSKRFMRELMARHGLPGQLAHHPFTNLQEALAFLDAHGPAWAVKPVGLTGGKGVQVFGDHFQDVEGAKEYVRSVFQGRTGGGAVQFEEIARGEEVTVMAFTDGTTLLPMPAVQDHKRLLEGDLGPNTGGMGSYSQADGLLPFLRAGEYVEAMRILQGIVGALRAEGTPYVGAIYGQFMLTASGPKVIEVNARLGDPEAMNVLHTLESDYLGLLEGMATGTLAGKEARFRPVATVVKYVVPKGYGEGSPATGKPVDVDDFNIKRTGGTAYMGSIENPPYGGLVTMASRTLAVLGEGPTVDHANAVCEASLRHVHGKDLYVRHDIGSPELLARRVQHMEQVRQGLAPQALH